MLSANAESWLSSLEGIGWRLGLERIRALLEELGNPQDSFESVHVVGTNGKSSVAVMVAALTIAKGRRAGSYLSPHLERWAQRVRVDGREPNAAAFERAAGRVKGAVERVEAQFEEGERVTQFEAATAVAFACLEEAGVEVGVIEAGLGGRLDATNVLASRVTALTSIGLDHTAWLGETEIEIAREKLAVLNQGSTLVLGDLSPAVTKLAIATAEELDCEVVQAGAIPPDAVVAAPYLRRNLAVALAAAGVVTGPLGAESVDRALDKLELPGRFELIPGDPPLVLDAAHNPDGALAVAEALAAAFGDRPVVACLAILADKDAGGIVSALAPALSAAVCTEIPTARLEGAGRPNATAAPASELARLCEEAGVPATAEADPEAAVRRATSLAATKGGTALVAGSHYLLAYAWTERRAQSSSR